MTSAVPQTALNGLYMLAVRVIVLFVNAALIVFLTRNLGVIEYGRYASAVAMTSWIPIAITVATNGPLVRAVSHREFEASQAARMLAVVFVISGAAGMALAVFAEPVSEALNSADLAPLLRILSLDLSAGSLALLYGHILVSQQRYSWNASVAIGGALFQLLVAFLITRGEHLATGACVALVSCSLAQVLIGRIGSGIRFLVRPEAHLTGMWKQAKLASLSPLGIYVLQSLDLVVLKLMSPSSSDVGLYAASLAISQAATMVIGPTRGVFIAAMVRALSGGATEEAGRLANLYVRLGLAYAGLIALCAQLSEPIVTFLLGAQYRSAAPILSALLVASALRVGFVVAQVLIVAAGDRGRTSIRITMLIVMALVFYTAGISSFGVVGATAVTILVAFIGCVTTLTDGLRLMRLKFPWMNLIKVGASVCVTSVVLQWLPLQSVHIIPRLFAYSALYAALLILFRETSICDLVNAFRHQGRRGKEPETNRTNP